VLVPENVESVKQRLSAAEQQVSELRLTVRIEADDLTIEEAAATFQVVS
jgi:hypothetical protein